MPAHALPLKSEGTKLTKKMKNKRCSRCEYLVLLSLRSKLLHTRVVAALLKSRGTSSLIFLAHHDFDLRGRAAAAEQHTQTRRVAAGGRLLRQRDRTIGGANDFQAEMLAKTGNHCRIVATDAVDSDLLHLRILKKTLNFVLNAKQ